MACALVFNAVAVWCIENFKLDRATSINENLSVCSAASFDPKKSSSSYDDDHHIWSSYDDDDDDLLAAGVGSSSRRLCWHWEHPASSPPTSTKLSKLPNSQFFYTKNHQTLLVIWLVFQNHDLLHNYQWHKSKSYVFSNSFTSVYSGKMEGILGGSILAKNTRIRALRQVCY